MFGYRVEIDKNGFAIPLEKPAYICEITSEEGQVLYQFSYRIAGTILEEGTGEKLEWGEARCCKYC